MLAHFAQGHQDLRHTICVRDTHHLLHKRAHRRDVDHLEVVHVDGAIVVHVLADLAQYGQQRHIGLTGACRSADQEVLVCL